MRAKSLIRKGVENPQKIPPFLLGKLFPSSRFGHWYKQTDRLVTWQKIDWGGLRDPPEHSAVTFYTYKMLDDMVGEESYERCLDIGCGFGYRTAWLSEFASDVYGIDPSKLALSEGKPYYPEFEFLQGAAQTLPFADNSFDLVTTWVVLLHVPPTEINGVGAEIRRVLSPDGTLLLFEETGGKGDRGHVQSRTIDDYKEIFGTLELVKTAKREVPNVRGENKRTLMKFEP